MSENKGVVVVSAEEAVTRIGQFGRFQKLLDVVLFLLTLPVAYQILISYFVTFTPSWKCRNGTQCEKRYPFSFHFCYYHYITIDVKRLG